MAAPARTVVLGICACLVAFNPAEATMVGPVPPRYTLDPGTYVFAGAVGQGETDDVACTLTECPEEPLCLFDVASLEIDLVAALQPDEQLLLTAGVIYGGEVSAPAEGIPAVAHLEVTQGDSCWEISVHGSRVDQVRPYLLRVAQTG